MSRTIFSGMAGVLKSSEWLRVGVVSRPGQLYKKLTRVVEIIGDNRQDEALTYADWLVDAGNDTNPAADPAACKFVDLPRAGSKRYPGRWGLVQNEQGSVKLQNRPTEIYGIIQTLRWGWAASITLEGGAPDFTYALAKYGKLRKELTITWRNLAADSLKTCAEAVPATLTNPTVQGCEYTGAWVRKGPVQTDLDEDGLGVLVAVFAIEPDTISMATEATAARTEITSVARCDTQAAANALLTAVVLPTAGQSLSGSIQPSPEGYKAVLQYGLAVKLDSGWVTRQDVWGTARRRSAINCTAAEAAAIYGELSDPYVVLGGIVYPINVNYFSEPSRVYKDRFDVTASEEPGKPYSLVLDQPWRNYTVEDTFWQEAQFGGKHYKRTVTRSVKNCGDETTAWAHQNGGTGENIQGSTVHDHGYSRFTSVRLQVDDSGDKMGWTEFTL